MLSTFNISIKQAKVDAIIGDKLLEDTEKFFKNNRALRKMINEYNPSLEQSTKNPSSSRRKRTSSIY